MAVAFPIRHSRFGVAASKRIQFLVCIGIIANALTIMCLVLSNKIFAQMQDTRWSLQAAIAASIEQTVKIFHGQESLPHELRSRR